MHRKPCDFCRAAELLRASLSANRDQSTTFGFVEQPHNGELSLKGLNRPTDADDVKNRCG